MYAILSDKYDFELDYSIEDLLVLFANSYAWVSQILGSLHPYEISVRIDFA